MRILVAEDDVHLGPSLKKGLEGNHYAVDLVGGGQEALSYSLTVPYDLIILDVLLPGLNGFEVCRRVRDSGKKMPILFLTALDGIDERVNGLDLGADDYLTKPFAFRELEARVRALLLRELLMRNPRQVLSRMMIAEHLWNVDAEHLSNVIDVYIRYLRRKLCENGEPNVIQTIRGFGYQLKEP